MLLPIGYDNFRELIDNQLDFVDKSLFIKDLIDDRAAKVAVITRPRRFGKTLNLSMLQHFLAAEVNEQKTAGLFDSLNIAQCDGGAYLQHQGKYPVIFVTFKSIKAFDFGSALADIAVLMSDLYLGHEYLLSSAALKDQDKRNFEAILRKTTDESGLKTALKNLTKYLYLHTKVKPWLLIDEYDTPIQSAYVNDNKDEAQIAYYERMINFMRVLFGEVLKTNASLARAVVTGILRIAKESLFSDVNNLKTYSIFHSKYSEYFGFTEPEVDMILAQSNLSGQAKAIKDWYNGYRIGKTVIYNPWSIANCIYEKGELKPYWINTSSNTLIKELLKHSSVDFKKEFEALIAGEASTQIVNEGMVLQGLTKDPTAVWSLLLLSGYLKPATMEGTLDGIRCQLAIPNQEVKSLFCQIIKQWLSNGLGLMWFNTFMAGLLAGDIAVFEKGLSEIIEQITSYHDFAKEPEAFYHGLLLGFIAHLHHSDYVIQSNRESGLGRYDIALIPKTNSNPGILMEFKAASDPKASLDALADAALLQIDEKAYAAVLKQYGIEKIIKLGISFRGKTFVLKEA